jgi:hypothetical protein
MPRKLPESAARKKSPGRVASRPEDAAELTPRESIRKPALSEAVTDRGSMLDLRMPRS